MPTAAPDKVSADPGLLSVDALLADTAAPQAVVAAVTNSQLTRSVLNSTRADKRSLAQLAFRLSGFASVFQQPPILPAVSTKQTQCLGNVDQYFHPLAIFIVRLVPDYWLLIASDNVFFIFMEQYCSFFTLAPNPVYSVGSRFCFQALPRESWSRLPTKRHRAPFRGHFHINWPVLLAPTRDQLAPDQNQNQQ